MKSRWINFSILQLILVAFITAPLSAADPSAFEVTGTGTVETNCFGTFFPGCTVTATGKMTGTPILPGDFSLRFDTGSPNSLNGYPSTIQGVCVPASFLGALTETGGDSIYFNHAGFACEEAGPSSPYVYHGTFRVTGGTGRFAAAVGSGIVVGTFTRDTAVALVYLRGSITY